MDSLISLFEASDVAGRQTNNDDVKIFTCINRSKLMPPRKEKRGQGGGARGVGKGSRREGIFKQDLTLKIGPVESFKADISAKGHQEPIRKMQLIFNSQSIE